jgi:hypothetical protein
MIMMTSDQRERAMELLPKMGWGFTPISMMDKWHDYYPEEHLDWHEFSILLDKLNSQGTVRLVGFNSSNMTQYEYCETA